MRTFCSVEDFVSASGQLIGHGDWHTVDQERIDRFAQVTDDNQWIHVDPDRAASGPFGGTIAHGYLTLSLLPALMRGAYLVQGHTMGVNYGLNKVRFPEPVPVDSKIRARVEVVDAAEVSAEVAQVCWKVSVEREGGSRPVCVAETLTRYSFV